MTQLQLIEAVLLVPSTTLQTLISTRRCPQPVSYVDRRSGKPWSSGGPLPFLAGPLFAGWGTR